MNLDQLQGNWKQVQGALRAQWGKLTDNDFEVIAGNRDRLVGRIQDLCGIRREEAEDKLRDWESTH